MAQPIELILMRQLAECLAMPIFVVDPAGDLLFYNERSARPWPSRLSPESSGWCRFITTPAYADDAVDRLLERARDQRPPFELIPGTEGLTIDL